MGVGGSFDVLTGNVQRAPEFWINHHIEWLFRLIQEPTRFKRMLALPRYLFRVYQQKFKQKNKASALFFISLGKIQTVRRHILFAHIQTAVPLSV